jgi:taurine dioxygenase
MQVIQLNNFFGAEIQGVNVTDASDNTIAELKELWLEHKVLVFHNQDITPQEHVQFSRHFGELEIHPFAKKLPNLPEVLVLESGGPTGRSHYSATDWHSDVSYREKPPMGSILRGVVIPEVGGDTCFSDATEAFNRLDEKTKFQVSELFAIHDWFKKNHHVLEESEYEEMRKKYPFVKHPVIRTHPETNQKAIFTNDFFTSHIDGLEDQESSWILRKLENAIRDASIQIRVHWDRNTIVMWDNRCVQHSGTDDFLPAHRRVERTTIMGDRPY